MYCHRFNHQVLVLLLLVWAPDFVPEPKGLNDDAERGTQTKSKHTVIVVAQAIWKWGWLVLSVLFIASSSVQLIGISFNEETNEVVCVVMLPHDMAQSDKNRITPLSFQLK